MDPALTDEETLLGLYEVSVRHADLSLLSSSVGLLDRREGLVWAPGRPGRTAGLPRGGGLRLQRLGHRYQGAVRRHQGPPQVRPTWRAPSYPEWRTMSTSSYSRRCSPRTTSVWPDVCSPGRVWSGTRPPRGHGVSPCRRTSWRRSRSRWMSTDSWTLAGQRGFLAARNRLSSRGEKKGPVVLVASGKGFTPWSRDSIEVLRSAGAQVRRLDLLEDAPLPAGVPRAWSWPARCGRRPYRTYL